MLRSGAFGMARMATPMRRPQAVVMAPRPQVLAAPSFIGGEHRGHERGSGRGLVLGLARGTAAMRQARPQKMAASMAFARSAPAAGWALCES